MARRRDPAGDSSRNHLHRYREAFRDQPQSNGLTLDREGRPIAASTSPAAARTENDGSTAVLGDPLRQ